MRAWLLNEDNMANKCDMRWFKQTFHEEIDAALEGTPFTLDLMTALACQETGMIWSTLRKKDLSLDRILELCVGDTIDAPSRKAFPKTKAALLTVAQGQEMFDLAHEALVDMAEFIPGFNGVASNPNKFCHGYGIFQLDLQFFEDDPDHFLQKRFANFDNSLQKALDELQSAREKIGLGNKPTLSDLELAHVAIAYNTGGFNPAKGLKQGFKPPGGKFYGEQVFEFLQIAKTVSVEDEITILPFTVDPDGPLFKVTATKLNLRSEPCVDSGSNIKASLKKGDIVQALSNQAVRGFLEVETVDPNSLTGFASAQFLEQI
jgi:hypothetical protein